MRKKAIILYILLFVLIFTVALTYAYYLPKVIGNENVGKTNVNTELIELKLANTKLVLGKIKNAGDSLTHTFSVTNSGDTRFDSYKLYFSDVYNDYFYDNYLVYTLTCNSVNTKTYEQKGTCKGVSETAAPQIAKLMIETGAIDPFTTHMYTLTITYKDSDFDQSIDKDREISFDILLNKYNESTPINKDTLRVSELNPTEASAFLNSPSPITRGKIESITFTDTTYIAPNVLGSWDVSAAGNGEIMAWYKDTNKDGLYEITIGQSRGVIANIDSSYLFSSLTNLKVINSLLLNTSSVINMSYMFAYCSSLLSLEIKSFNTAKVTNVDRMFSDCSALTILDLTNFNTNSITTYTNMFYNYGSEFTVILSNTNSAWFTDKFPSLISIT